MFRKPQTRGAIFSTTGNPLFTPRKMASPRPRGENTNFLICGWILLCDSSFCSYFNGENISVRNIQQKLICNPLKG